MNRFSRGDDDGVNAEIQDYLERETARNIEAGMSAEEALLAARRKLGPVARVTEETREAAAGGVWTWIEMLWRDLRHGVRMFSKNPGFTLTCVLSLAFGTGANVAMFSAADALLLRPLPVPRPGEVITVGSHYSLGYFSYVQTSYLNYLDIRDQSRSFEGLTAFSTITVGLAADPQAAAQVKSGMAVAGNFFDVMEVHPALGRGFRQDEDQVRGRDAVVVLSDPTWQAIGADPKIVGRKVRLAGIDFTVVGIAPESFTGPDHIWTPAFYIPAAMWPAVSGDPRTLDDRSNWSFTVKGRLKPGVSLSQAQAELNTIAANLERAHPDTNRKQRLTAITELQMNLRQNQVYTALVGILALLAIAVLIVACANVAGLLTSRAPLRAREIALRLAVGAGRVRFIRQLLTESSLMAIAGGLLGLPLAYACIQIMRRVQFPNDLLVVPRIELDQRALLFSVLIAMGSVILFGLIPAIQTTRSNLTTAFKAGDVELGRSRFSGRNLLVAIQVAFSLVLLTLSAFSYRAFGGELNRGMGFRRDHIAMITVRPRGLRYTDAQAMQFYEKLSQRSAAVPGVRLAALSSAKPAGVLDPFSIQPEGFHFPAGQNSALVYGSRIGEHYFDALEIPILRGRGIAATDTSTAPPVAVVNETLAEHYWPNQNPLGKRILVNGVRWAEVVGVAKNSRYLFITEPPTDFLYLPYRQMSQIDMTLFAVAAGDSASLLEPLRRLVLDIEPNMPMYNVQTMEYYYDARATSIGQVIVEIIGAMGIMGLALAMIGLYALMSYSVSRRTREIGIRMAVGADRMNVMRMVVRQGLIPVLAGIAAGLALSVGAGDLLKRSFPLGYEIGPSIYGWVAPILLLIAIAAAYAPARRAALVDPMTALREE